MRDLGLGIIGLLRIRSRWSSSARQSRPGTVAGDLLHHPVQIFVRGPAILPATGSGPRGQSAGQAPRTETSRQVGSCEDRSRSNVQMSVISVTASVPATG